MLDEIAWSKLVWVAVTAQGVAASASVSSLLNGAGILYKINYLFFLLRLRDLCEEEGNHGVRPWHEFAVDIDLRIHTREESLLVSKQPEVRHYAMGGGNSGVSTYSDCIRIALA